MKRRWVKVRPGWYACDEWRIVRARREEHFWLPLWFAERLNRDGTRYVPITEVFSTLAEAKRHLEAVTVGFDEVTQ